MSKHQLNDHFLATKLWLSWHTLISSLGIGNQFRLNKSGEKMELWVDLSAPSGLAKFLKPSEKWSPQQNLFVSGSTGVFSSPWQTQCKSQMRGSLHPHFRLCFHLGNLCDFVWDGKLLKGTPSHARQHSAVVTATTAHWPPSQFGKPMHCTKEGTFFEWLLHRFRRIANVQPRNTRSPNCEHNLNPLSPLLTSLEHRHLVISHKIRAKMETAISEHKHGPPLHKDWQCWVSSYPAS